MKEQVLDLIQQYCDVLRTNFQTYAIEGHRKFLDDPETKEYHQRQIDELSEGVGLYKYTFEKGRKYARIVMQMPNGQKSSHAFVDLNNGNVYKPKDWRSPSLNGVRYNLLDDKSREQMYQRADWCGYYLYK